MNEYVYTMTTDSGRMVTCRGDVSKMAETEAETEVYLTFETAAGSTMTVTYKIADSPAIQDVVDSVQSLLDRALVLLTQEVLNMMMGQGE